MKRGFRALWALVRVAFVFALALTIVADLYCELVGVPPVARDTVEGLVANHGWRARLQRVKFGLVRGLVAEGVILSTDDRPGSRLLEAEEVRVSLSLQSLLHGNLLPCRVAVSNGSIRVPCFAGTELGGTLLGVQDVSGRFYCGDRTFSVTRLSGTVEGLRLDLSGELALSESAAADGTGKGANLAEALRRFVQEHRSEVETVLARVRSLHLSEGNAFLDLRLDGTLSDLTQARIAGRVRVNDAVVRGSVVSRLLATFRYADGEWRFQNVTVLTDRDGLVEAEVAFWPRDRQVEGRVRGTLPLSVARTWAGSGQIWFPSELDSEQPVQFTAVLQRSPWRLRDWKADITCRATACRFRELWIRSAAAKFTYGGGRLDADAVELNAGRSGAERLAGRATWWLDEKRVAGQFRGTCSLLKLGAQVGLIPPSLAGDMKLNFAPAEVEFTLEPSPYDWLEWRGCGNVRVPGGSIGAYRAGNLAGAVNLENGLLKVDNLALDWGDAPGAGGIVGAVAVDLREFSARDTVAVTFQAGIREAAPGPVAPVVGVPDEGVLSCSGSLVIRPGARRLQGKVAGRLQPLRAYEALRRPLSLPVVAQFSDIQQSGPPPVFSLDLPDTPWTLEGWELRGQVSGQDLAYRALRFTRCFGSIEVNSERVLFRGLTGEAEDGTRVMLDLGVDFNPVCLSISGTYVGDPRHIVEFIYDDEGQRVYLAIWDDFHWQQASPPELTVDEFRIGVWPGKGNWALKMRGRFDVVNAVYRGVSADRIEMAVSLDLPQRVTLNDIRMTRGKDEMRGQLRIQIEGLTTYEFDIDGVLDPKELLRAVEPGMEKRLADFDFAPGTRISCKGSLFHSREPMLRLSGTLTAPTMTYRKLRIDDLQGDWQVAESTVRWNVNKGTLHGGRFATRGYFDTASGAGVLAVDAAGVDLRRLAEDFQIEATDTDRVTEGKLTGHCQVQILDGWAGQPLQLTGNGHALISEGNLWNIPFLFQLGQVLDLTMLSRLSRGKVGGIGKISILDADLEFKGRKLLVPQMRTDGTLLSLSGNGEYNWQTGAINMNVKGETLRQLGVLSLALLPLSWVFDAELTGTLESHQWHMKTALQRAFTGKDAPEAPAGEVAPPTQNDVPPPQP